MLNSFHAYNFIDSKEIYEENNKLIFDCTNSIGSFETIESYNSENAENYTDFALIKMFLNASDEDKRLMHTINRKKNTFPNLFQECRTEISELIAKGNARFIDEYSQEIERMFGEFSYSIGNYSEVVDIYVPKERLDINCEEFTDFVNDNEMIDSVYLYPISSDEISELSNNTLNDAITSIHANDMVQNREYSGNGISLGIIEAKSVPNFSLYPKSFEGRKTSYMGKQTINGDTSHADAVAIICAGNNGLASNSRIYATTAIGPGSMISRLRTMADIGVNVVNLSLSLGDDDGKYQGYEREVDQIVKNSSMTIVAASGNRGDSADHAMASPAVAYNSVSVGACLEGNDRLRAEYSEYRDNKDCGNSKPNIMAPGTISTEPYERAGNYSPSGTSFAAPLVTGSISLLMEEFPFLKTSAESVFSILTSSAEPMSDIYDISSDSSYYDGSGLHNEIGSGLLNYEKAREAARNVIQIEAEESNYIGELSNNIDIVANSSQRIRASLAWLANGKSKNNVTNYDLMLYKYELDGSKTLVSRIQDPQNNVEFIDYDVKEAGKYCLSVMKSGTNKSLDKLALSYVLIDDNGGSTSGGIKFKDENNAFIEVTGDNYSIFSENYNLEEYQDYMVTSSRDCVEVKALRARFFENKLVLSAKSDDADKAYLEMVFGGYFIYSLEYQFGLWSDDESLIRKSAIKLEGLRNGCWHELRIFDPKEMSTDYKKPKTYVDGIGYPVEGIRFVVETNKTNNKNNVGRVVIGKIKGTIHEHARYLKYERYNSETHKVSCTCGYCEYKNHVWGSTYFSSGKEYADCVYCLYKKNITDEPIVTPIV